ncbi:MAG TPA: isocitrate lyase/phosphoenolpyruvate mutase family protein, partial [Vicinamibacteria bacterium]|nr:isocitrate lyase/phosphoenolpyruvate mutase family protein [Vicinamibacteria bacterium]
NLEDADEPEAPLLDLELQVERLRAAREAAQAAGVPIVINARTDVFLAGIGTPESRFDHAVRRLNAYRRAGADCLFCPLVEDSATIERLVRELEGPLNVLARGSAPSVPELERMGVRRVSLGAGLMRAALGAVHRVAAEMAGPGTYDALRGLLWREDVNRFFVR